MSANLAWTVTATALFSAFAVGAFAPGPEAVAAADLQAAYADGYRAGFEAGLARTFGEAE